MDFCNSGCGSWPVKCEWHKIVDKNNQAYQLRGMSLFWSQWEGTFGPPEWLKTRIGIPM